METYSLSEYSKHKKNRHRQILEERRIAEKSRRDIEALLADSQDDDDDELVDSYFFLQPLKTRQRRILLHQAGITKIDGMEKNECNEIRFSRESCGCSCKQICIPESCLCNLSGIHCQVDRMSFPCSCTRDGCGNEHGRIEFNPSRVRKHFNQTLMQLEMERNVNVSDEIPPENDSEENQTMSCDPDDLDLTLTPPDLSENCPDVNGHYTNLRRKSLEAHARRLEAEERNELNIPLDETECLNGLLDANDTLDFVSNVTDDNLVKDDTGSENSDSLSESSEDKEGLSDLASFDGRLVYDGHTRWHDGSVGVGRSRSCKRPAPVSNYSPRKGKTKYTTVSSSKFVVDNTEKQSKSAWVEQPSWDSDGCLSSCVVKIDSKFVDCLSSKSSSEMKGAKPFKESSSLDVKYNDKGKKLSPLTSSISIPLRDCKKDLIKSEQDGKKSSVSLETKSCSDLNSSLVTTTLSPFRNSDSNAVPSPFRGNSTRAISDADLYGLTPRRAAAIRSRYGCKALPESTGSLSDPEKSSKQTWNKSIGVTLQKKSFELPQSGSANHQLSTPSQFNASNQPSTSSQLMTDLISSSRPTTLSQLTFPNHPIEGTSMKRSVRSLFDPKKSRLNTLEDVELVSSQKSVDGRSEVKLDDSLNTKRQEVVATSPKKSGDMLCCSKDKNSTGSLMRNGEVAQVDLKSDTNKDDHLTRSNRNEKEISSMKSTDLISTRSRQNPVDCSIEAVLPKRSPRLYLEKEKKNCLDALNIDVPVTKKSLNLLSTVKLEEEQRNSGNHNIEVMPAKKSEIKNVNHQDDAISKIERKSPKKSELKKKDLQNTGNQNIEAVPSKKADTRKEDSPGAENRNIEVKSPKKSDLKQREDQNIVYQNIKTTPPKKNETKTEDQQSFESRNIEVKSPKKSELKRKEDQNIGNQNIKTTSPKKNETKTEDQQSFESQNFEVKSPKKSELKRKDNQNTGNGAMEGMSPKKDVVLLSQTENCDHLKTFNPKNDITTPKRSVRLLFDIEKKNGLTTPARSVEVTSSKKALNFLSNTENADGQTTGNPKVGMAPPKRSICRLFCDSEKRENTRSRYLEDALPKKCCALSSSSITDDRVDTANRNTAATTPKRSTRLLCETEKKNCTNTPNVDVGARSSFLPSDVQQNTSNIDVVQTPKRSVRLVFESEKKNRLNAVVNVTTSPRKSARGQCNGSDNEKPVAALNLNDETVKESLAETASA